MELTPLPSVFIYLPITLVCLSLRLIFLRVYILSLSFLSMDWRFLCYAFVMMHSQIKTITYSFASFFAWFWQHNDKRLLVMRCPKNLFMFGCTNVYPHSILEPNYAQIIWYLACYTSHGKCLWTLALFGPSFFYLWYNKYLAIPSSIGFKKLLIFLDVRDNPTQFLLRRTNQIIGHGSRKGLHYPLVTWIHVGPTIVLYSTWCI